DLILRYYENPRTIGSVVTGTEFGYKCPQVVEISDQENRPIMMIRSEQNASGRIFLCSLDYKGGHENWGPVTVMSRDDFVKRVLDVMFQMKQGNPGSATSNQTSGSREVGP